MTQEIYRDYTKDLRLALDECNYEAVHILATELRALWERGSRFFICGNGGSAANAIHISNDLLYGVAKNSKKGLKVSALTANSSILTCLANDVSYDAVFSEQLKAQAEAGDILLVLSGSGNSPNVVSALNTARKLQMKTFAILGYSGGECLKIADHAIHVNMQDMQIAEDMQLIVGHMVMRWLLANPPLFARNTSPGVELEKQL